MWSKRICKGKEQNYEGFITCFVTKNLTRTCLQKIIYFKLMTQNWHQSQTQIVAKPKSWQILTKQHFN